MINKFKVVFLILTVVCFSPIAAQVKTLKVFSPDQSIVYTVSIENGYPEYTISKNGKLIIDTSSLGLTINGQQISAGNSFRLSGRKHVNNTYETRGVHSLAKNKYNEAIFSVTGHNEYTIEVKVFNDGAAFRYRVKNQTNSVINNELTAFRIPSGSTIWSQNNITTYEGDYKKQNIEEVRKGQIAGPPLTIQLAGNTGYAAITEGGLIDFAGMSLIADSNRIFKANLTGTTQRNKLIETPWRVILIGGTLNALVNSDVIGNVSPPLNRKLFPAGFHTDWIRPGKSVWSWLAENGKMTFENMKKFSDWAGKLNIKYNLVDEGWAKWNDQGKNRWELMKELVRYSAKRGVKIWAWKAYPDRDGDPGIKDAQARITFFKKCKKAGIAGLKIDFFDTESQEVINFYQAALKDAAALHLMLDFHGANKPTGESRTWPNEMSREGVMGLENWTHWPTHNTTLIFTRFLAGPADYTPLSFSDNVKSTTLTHQVATVAAFTSPFMCLGVDPEKLLKSKVKNMVKQIPVVWDETIILPQSKIGELAVMARRSGKTWFLIALNGEMANDLKINLKFLGKGNYSGNLLEDAEADRKQAVEKNVRFNKGNSIRMTLLPGGGFIGRFYK